MRHIKNIINKGLGHQVEVRSWGFEVISCESGESYPVFVNDGIPACSCKWATRGGTRTAPSPSFCSHTVAVINHMINEDSSLSQYKATIRQGEVGWEHLHRKMTAVDGVTITYRLQ